MRSEELEIELAKFASGIRDHATAFLDYLGEKHASSGEFSEAPYDKLVWTDGTGQKGPYQMASAKNNNNSELYKHFEAILKKNSGRFSEKSWCHYYWLGTEGNCIFRRLKKRFQ